MCVAFRACASASRVSGSDSAASQAGPRIVDHVVERFQSRLVVRPGPAMNRSISCARARARDRRSVAVTLGSAIEAASFRQLVAVGRLGLRRRGFRSCQRAVGDLLVPGRIAVSLGQAPMGGDVFGIDGERAPIGGDRLLEIIAPHRGL